MKYSKELHADQKVILLIYRFLQTTLKQTWLRHIGAKFIFARYGLLQMKRQSAVHILRKLFSIGLKTFSFFKFFFFFPHLINSCTQLTHQHKAFSRNLFREHAEEGFCYVSEKPNCSKTIL